MQDFWQVYSIQNLRGSYMYRSMIYTYTIIHACISWNNCPTSDPSCWTLTDLHSRISCNRFNTDADRRIVIFDFNWSGLEYKVSDLPWAQEQQPVSKTSKGTNATSREVFFPADTFCSLFSMAASSSFFLLLPLTLWISTRLAMSKWEVNNKAR